MTKRRYALRDDQWELIKDFLPGRKDAVGVTPGITGCLLRGVLYRYRAGIAWRYLPEQSGDYRVIHTRHMRQSKNGVWQRVFGHLAGEADNGYAALDSTIVRAHQHAAGAKGGIGKPNASGDQGAG